jgi:hypothetical protein
VNPKKPEPQKPANSQESRNEEAETKVAQAPPERQRIDGTGT